MELLQSCGKEKYKVYNKSTLSRAESGSAGEKTIIKWAKVYCDVFNYSEKQTEQFLRGDKIAIPDTSALLKNSQLVDELGEEYNIVVIPNIVIRELDGIKNSNAGTLGKRAWEIIRGIGYGKRVIKRDYSGDKGCVQTTISLMFLTAISIPVISLGSSVRKSQSRIMVMRLLNIQKFFDGDENNRDT